MNCEQAMYGQAALNMLLVLSILGRHDDSSRTRASKAWNDEP